MNKKNFVAFVTGKRGSGKSHELNRLAQKFPRRLVLDFLGEHEGAIPGAVEAWTFGDTLSALQRVQKLPRWTVVSSMDERYVPQLLEVLAPSFRGGAPGYSKSVGGMVLELGECDTVWPNGGSSPEARGVVKRGRHHWLSILAATQRPAETDRIITSQADIICSFRQHEPRDLAYLSAVMGGSRVAPLLTTLQPYHFLRYWVGTGALERVAPDGSSVTV